MLAGGGGGGGSTTAPPSEPKAAVKPATLEQYVAKQNGYLVLVQQSYLGTKLLERREGDDAFGAASVYVEARRDRRGHRSCCTERHDPREDLRRPP